jgi:hypothetical protein
MARHGQEMHFVRPDRVYATGVLSPIVGYQPAEDAQQVAARFVGGGQGLGLAGPRAEVRLMGGSFRPLRGARFDSILSWFRNLVANFRVRMQVARLRREMKVLPPASGQTPSGKNELDTSPRPGVPPQPGSIPVQSGWSPSPQSPAGIATTLNPVPEVPTMPSISASMQLAPQATSLPAQYWGQIIGPTLPPTVAARATGDALRTFFSNLSGGRRRR